MRKAKRGNDHRTRGIRKNKKARKIESVVSGYLHGDSNQDIWSGISDEKKSYLSKSVASVTLCNGSTTLFSCSGIAIDSQRFLTSASLVKALDDTANKDHIDLKIEVRHEGNRVCEGYLAEFDLDHNFAVVNAHAFLDVHVALQHVLGTLPHADVLLVAVGRGISGKLMARNVKLIGDLRASEDDEDKLSDAWEGGPLFSYDGNFVGMNLFLTTRRAFFLPWGAISEHLEQQIALYRFGARSIGEKSSGQLEVHRDLNQEQLDLDCMGYPKLPPTMLGAGMILVNTFEETFGDIFGEGVWSNLSKRASSNIDWSVVALASFNGEKRFFACSGFFIEWNRSKVILTSASLVRNSGDENKIVDSLRIEVLLPHNQCREGTLLHYNLRYNVALVSVMNYHAHRSVNTLLDWTNMFEVAAVGRCFKSGTLMATAGELVSWSGTLDCNFLIRSSCKITKFGIGGPLVNLDGDVIGMNFYDKKIGTPFLSWDTICDILVSFEGKSGEVGNDDPSGAPSWKIAGDDNIRLNRWPVPMPCWRHADYLDEGKSGDDDGFDYGYVNGEKVMLF